MTDPRTELVGRGYDAMIDTWEAWSAQVTDDPRHEWTADLAGRLAEGARVLELGCGGGTAETQALAARFRLTGVDLSERQLERARARVPSAVFVRGDLTAVEFDDASFEAVVAYYSFNHVPRELLAPVFARIGRWLVPGGYFMAALGASDLEDWTGDFLGAPTFFSGFPPETNSRLLGEAGFELLRDEIVTITEPEGPATFHWVLARR
ncbi:MAG TPA: class I SAM-dependent methyltransferase [Gaiellaceae bacterium]|jgi:SAM-dependent methyltransferase